MIPGPWLSGVLAAWMISTGPPALPPLPGSGGSAPETENEPPPEAPQEPPAPAPTPTGPTTTGHDPSAERGHSSDATPSAPPTSPASGLGAVPEVEPPQPEAMGPRATEPPDGSTHDRSNGTPRSRHDDAGPGSPGEIVGAVEDDGKPPAIPAPQRPPYTGVGLFIGASATFTIALAEQIVAHVLVKRRCIDPVDDESFEKVDDAEVLGEVVAQCIPGVIPAIVLRVHSDIGLLATIGLAAGGAILRGRRAAYDDVFADRPPRNVRRLRLAGISLIGVGVVTWFTTGAAAWGLLAGCKSGKCAARARLMAFTTRDAGAALVAAGAGMLGFAEAYRRGHGGFVRDRALSLAPTLGPRGFRLGLSGRF